ETGMTAPKGAEPRWATVRALARRRIWGLLLKEVGYRGRVTCCFRVSALAAVALGVATRGTAADGPAVFGVWAVIAGAVQFVVALRRRARSWAHPTEERGT